MTSVREETSAKNGHTATSHLEKRVVRVKKTNGEHQHFDAAKVRQRLQRLIEKKPVLDAAHLDIDLLVRKAQMQANDGIDGVNFDKLLAEICNYQVQTHPDYELLAARVLISALHKRSPPKFSQRMRVAYENKHPRTGEQYPLIRQEIYELIERNAEAYDAIVNYDADYTYRYFGLRTMMRQSYLLKKGGTKASDDQLVESPQDMLMRASVEVWRDNVEMVRRCYTALSQHYFVFATPTLLNSCTQQNQMSSCFLMTIPDDSLESIYKTLYECAMISKAAGGIALSVHKIRGAGAVIKKSNGVSNGLVPMLRNYNDTARYVDQGGGKRKGAFAIYLEPWHSDIEDWLDLKKNHGKEERRCRDLFYALWTPDLFMQRVEEDGEWTLFTPDEAPGLFDVYGDEFRELYERYEREGRGRKTLHAVDLWQKILTSQVETGTPYMLYKDACNLRSNQKNLGTIYSSNLCCEIVEYNSGDEIAVCNLSSLSLPNYVVDDNNGGGKRFDFDKLGEVVRLCVRNLNRLVDISFYPVQKCEHSNLKHRPMGIGVQGLADVFFQLRMPYTSQEARDLNRRIFECMYYNAVDESCTLAKEEGTYSSFDGSPISQGVFQFDMWPEDRVQLCGDYDWDTLRQRVREHGVRNSLLIALMPTASTSSILGNTESFEPTTSNLYTRRTLAGDFTIVNRYLIGALQSEGLWDERMQETLMYTRGSVQHIKCVPQWIKEVYKTVWEVKQRSIIEMAADRGQFVCQSQSLNLHIRDPETRLGDSPISTKLSTCHFYGWKSGLKTGQYYLRTKPASNAAAVTIDRSKLLELNYDYVDSEVPVAGAQNGTLAAQSEEEQEENQQKNGQAPNGSEVCALRTGDDGEECFVCGS